MSTHLTIDRGRIVKPHRDRPSNPVGVSVILWLVCAVALMGVIGWAAI